MPEYNESADIENSGGPLNESTSALLTYGLGYFSFNSGKRFGPEAQSNEMPPFSPCNASFSECPSSPEPLDICVIDSDRDVIIIDGDEVEDYEACRQMLGLQQSKSDGRLVPTTTAEASNDGPKPLHPSGRRKKKKKQKKRKGARPAISKTACLQSQATAVFLSQTEVAENDQSSHSRVSSLARIPILEKLLPANSAPLENIAFQAPPDEEVPGTSDTNDALNDRIIEVEPQESDPQVKHASDRLQSAKLDHDSTLNSTFNSITSDIYSDLNNSDYYPLPSMKKKRRRVEEDMGYSQRRKRKRRRLGQLSESGNPIPHRYVLIRYKYI